jgi:PTH1 family peptidyl-tRNA hydrolase
MEGAGDPQQASDWLLFGLGNPGSRYAATRHNLGWRWIDRLAERFRVRLSAGRADYFYARTNLGQHRVHLIKPTTWMNLSGRAVRQYLAIERPAAPRIVAGLDDVALPLGRLRVRPRGSAGGHNGLASIIEHLGTEDFPRVRMGVGPGPAGADLADFVLEEFTREERDPVEALLDRAAEAAGCLIEEGPEAAMGRFNG